MSPVLLVLGLAFIVGLASGGSKAKPKTNAECLRLLGEQLFDTTTKQTPEARAGTIAWLQSVGLVAAANCMQQHAANLAPCRELIVAAVQFDIGTRSPAELLDLETKARADGLTAAADCLAQIRASKETLA